MTMATAMAMAMAIAVAVGHVESPRTVGGVGTLARTATGTQTGTGILYGNLERKMKLKAA